MLFQAKLNIQLIFIGVSKNHTFAPSKTVNNETMQDKNGVISIGNLLADMVAVVVSCPCLSLETR